MNQVLDLIQSCEVKEPQIVGNIAMVGLCDPNAPEELPVISLSEALRSKAITIREAGAYTELEFRPQQPTLLRASEGVIKGGMQDRIVKQSQVLEESRVLDVYCIEQGRWHKEKGDWQNVNLPVPIRRAILEERDQGTIWSMIQDYLQEWKVKTRTEALSAIYDALGHRFEKFVANLEWWRNQVGMIVVINGVASGLEYFGAKQTFQHDGMRLLRESYVPEAMRGDRVPMLPGDVTKGLSEFFDEIKADKRKVEYVPYQGRIVYASVI